MGGPELSSLVSSVAPTDGSHGTIDGIVLFVEPLGPIPKVLYLSFLST
jgi:hypothetical protein